MAQKIEQSSFRLTYFAHTGRAASIREAAVLGGISFEDRFITGEEHKAQQADGKRRWNGVPELTILDKNGKEIVTIGQSNSCLRYVGSISGTYPKGNVERALVDEILDSCEDLIGIFVKVMAPLQDTKGTFKNFFEKDKEKKNKALSEVFNDKALYWFAKFEARLEENEKRGHKNGFFVGDSITIADLKFVKLVSGMNRLPGALEKVKKENKRIAKLIDAVGNNEKIQEFRELFAKNLEDAKANNKSEYKYNGKFVSDDL